MSLLIISYYLFEILYRWVADWPSMVENVLAPKSINMLLICENRSFCWVLIYLYSGLNDESSALISFL